MAAQHNDSDLVSRLRDQATVNALEHPTKCPEQFLQWEAADRIEELEGQVRDLEQTIKEIERY